MFFKKRKPMWILIISLIALALVAATAGIIRNRKLQKKIDRGELDAMPEVQEVDAECCGQHEICERDSLLAAVSKQMNITMTKNWTNHRHRSRCLYSRAGRRVPRRVLHHARHGRSRMGAQPATAWHSLAGQHQG